MFDAEISGKVAGRRGRGIGRKCHISMRVTMCGEVYVWACWADDYRVGLTNDLHQKHIGWFCSSIRNNDRVSRHLDFRAVATLPTSSWCKSRFQFTVNSRPPIVLARNAPCVCTRFLLGVPQGIIVIDNFAVLPTFSPPATRQPSTKRDDWTGWAAHRA